MAQPAVFSRVDGDEEIYIGGLPSVTEEHPLLEKNITHILSLAPIIGSREALAGRENLFIKILDYPDEDLLVHLPKAVRFIDQGLQRGAVLVHCAAGRSRSVSCVVAYLLWKHPDTFGPADETRARARGRGRARRAAGSGKEPVRRALAVIRKTRQSAQPNPGFMSQLELWWEMGCPADGVEGQPAYHRWLFRMEVETSVACGVGPLKLRFEDEDEGGGDDDDDDGGAGLELRCKRCRRVLADQRFTIDHSQGCCPHHFVEPLLWMKPALERGELEGRLVCPDARCGSSVGRYSWKGFKCSCGQWVTPAFSLQKSKVDRVVSGRTSAHSTTIRGVRSPPGIDRTVSDLEPGGRPDC